MPSDTTRPDAQTREELAAEIATALDGREIRRGCVASARVWQGGGHVRVYIEYRITAGGASPKARAAGYLEIVTDEDGDPRCSLDHLTAEESAIDRALDETVFT